MSSELQGMSGDHRYYLLKVAHEHYGCAPGELNAEQLQRATGIVSRQRRIEEAVLRSQEATGVVIPPIQVEEALAQIGSRYEDGAALRQALASHGLSDDELRVLLARELKVEAILERVAASLPLLSDTDLSLYYFNHPEQFERPACREARHILITINPDFPENTRAAALARIEVIARRLRQRPERFAEEALKHSECPTALNGGLLGQVSAGALYPALEDRLFALAAGELSAVVESPMGFHLIRCESITPARRLSLEEALPRLRDRLQARQRKAHQRQWLERLLQPFAPVENPSHG
ncbi:nitrogen fixation protein NifM [Pseudomonas oryzae]|uniref:peptidylprolyl isomerase n=1 Tax=Pseudomonas oryzae TaxID=1392877 RepID=A0A1H1LTU5_9PSED|nr:nitrogen fixation protein NifM [Pseudomonas oryzae]SDR78044.1 peptidyl-prolyl cis-trans isomerase C [Pseudomonas oryzae]